jgi:hypothetical protein
MHKTPLLAGSYDVCVYKPNSVHHLITQGAIGIYLEYMSPYISLRHSYQLLDKHGLALR